MRSLKEVALLEGGAAVEIGGVGGGVVVNEGSFLLLCGWEGLGVGTSLLNEVIGNILGGVDGCPCVRNGGKLPLV